MQIAFQGGDVYAERKNSVFHFRARDLLAILGVGDIGSVLYNMKTRFNNFVPIPGSGNRGRGHFVKVSENEVLNFLDSIHANTKPRTMFLMQEFVKQFRD